MTDAGRAQIAQPGFSAAGNGLLNALIAYWPGNEANGNALDLHTNALHLNDIATVTSNPGLVYATARQYTAANLEYHTRVGDDAPLSAGDLDFTLAAWCYLDSKIPAAVQSIASKFGPSGQRGYVLYYRQTSDSFEFQVSNNGTATTTRTAATLGSPALAAWYLTICWHDSTGDTINIQVNDGAVDSTAYALGVFDNTAPFQIGAYNVSSVWSGRIGPTMFWKSAAGGGGVLTAAQRTALYNAGAGLPYASFTL